LQVVTSAFNELQAQHERRRSNAAEQATAAASGEQVHGRWGAFTSRSAWTGDAGAQPELAKPAPAAAAPIVAAAAKPAGNRWGRPAADYGKLFKPSAVAQPPCPAEQQRGHAQAQENSVPTAPSPGSGCEGSSRPQHSQPTGAGVAPSAFYAARSRRQSQPDQPTSLYSLFASQALGSALSNRAAAGPATTSQASPKPAPPQPAQPTLGHPPDCSVGEAGSSKWGSKPAALLDLLRHSAPWPNSAAAAAAGGSPGAAAQQAPPGRGSGRQKRQPQAQLVLLESSDSEDEGLPFDKGSPGTSGGHAALLFGSSASLEVLHALAECSHLY
jgi:hypothetical protein